ncbi:hypothetical protein E2C01_088433 [Portunus trituberculatus]|uniref:Uncharacterized protein n=1 Tax=Portunus trituberculatus TaxID=210409 RepID=A0A5B7JJU6_PORTR|nr:hypothetical protein [Portunus trituberculatus]
MYYYSPIHPTTHTHCRGVTKERHKSGESPRTCRARGQTGSQSLASLAASPLDLSWHICVAN